MNIQLTLEERHFIYQWFKQMLGRELSGEQLNAINQQQFKPLFAFLSDLGFAEEIQLLNNEWAKLRQFAQPRLELAADFAQCFLLDGQSSAVPYASAYLVEPEISQNLQTMDDYLQQFNLQINRQNNEPSDHLAVYLEILQVLLQQGNEANIQTFLQQQLLTWLPMFKQKVEKIETATKIYQILTALLLYFVQQDCCEFYDIKVNLYKE